MTTSSLKSKTLSAAAKAASKDRGAHVVVSFSKVPVLSKDKHRQLEQAARDVSVTARRMFPVL